MPTPTDFQLPALPAENDRMEIQWRGSGGAVTRFWVPTKFGEMERSDQIEYMLSRPDFQEWMNEDGRVAMQAEESKYVQDSGKSDIDAWSLYKLATVDDPEAEKNIVANFLGVSAKDSGLHKTSQGTWSYKQNGETKQFEPELTFAGVGKRMLAATAAYGPEIAASIYAPQRMGVSMIGKGLAAAGGGWTGEVLGRQLPGYAFGDRQSDAQRATRATAIAAGAGGAEMYAARGVRLPVSGPGQADAVANRALLDDIGLRGYDNAQVFDDPMLGGAKMYTASQPTPQQALLRATERELDDSVILAMDDFSGPAQSVDRVSKIATEGARTARQGVLDARAARTEKFYEAARHYNPEIDASDLVKQFGALQAKIPKNTSTSTVADIKQIQAILGKGRIRLADWDTGTDVGGLNKALDEVIGNISKENPLGQKSPLYAKAVELRKELYRRFEDVSDPYRIARIKYKKHPGADNVKQGPIGKTIKAGGNLDPQVASHAVEQLFEPNITPALMARNRRIINRFDSTGETWEAASSHWLRTQWQGALKPTQEAVITNTPGKIWKALSGTVEQKARMKAMLGTDKYLKFEKLMNGLELVAKYRVDRGMSQTAPQGGFKQIEDDLSEPLVQRMLHLKNVFNRMGDNKSKNAFMEQVVQSLYDPAKNDAFVKLYRWKPTSRKWRTLAMDVIGFPTANAIVDDPSLMLMPYAVYQAGKAALPNIRLPNASPQSSGGGYNKP